VGTEKRREKVVVLRELQRAIIYTREMSKQVTEGHVSTAFIAYSVNEGARLTNLIALPYTSHEMDAIEVYIIISATQLPSLK
jgi:hypothetical protein